MLNGISNVIITHDEANMRIIRSRCVSNWFLIMFLESTGKRLLNSSCETHQALAASNVQLIAQSTTFQRKYQTTTNKHILSFKPLLSNAFKFSIHFLYGTFLFTSIVKLRAKKANVHRTTPSRDVSPRHPVRLRMLRSPCASHAHFLLRWRVRALRQIILKQAQGN